MGGRERPGVHARASALVLYVCAWGLVLLLPASLMVASVVALAVPGAPLDRTEALPTLIAATVLTLALAWPAWRQMSRSAHPEQGGLRIRSFCRTHHVPWEDVVAVDVGLAQSFYSRLAMGGVFVKFRAANRLRTVNVAPSWYRGHQDALELVSWAPQWSPVRRTLEIPETPPPGSPVSSSFQDSQLKPAWDGEPFTGVIRPPWSLRGLVLSVCTVGTGAALAALATCATALAGSTSPAWPITGVALFTLATAFFVRVLFGAWSVRVVLEPTRLIAVGYLTKRYVDAAAVQRVAVQPSGAGQYDYLVLHNGKAVPLSATAKFGFTGDLNPLLARWWGD